MLEKFGKKSLVITDIDPDALDKFIDVDLYTVDLCGVNGDPIYHKNFIELIRVVKKRSKFITIMTNGSYRTKKWWNRLTDELSELDNIIFSIDGIPENFTEYRVNADWESMLIGIQECVKSSVQTTWKYIPFSFNEYDIDKARKLSIELGFDNFDVTYSDRWEENDWLKPKNLDFRIESEIVKNDFKNNKQKDFEIDPECKSKNMHYVNASGYYMPCCYVGDFRFYYKSPWWKNKENYNIKKSTLSSQIDNFNIFFETIHTDKPDYCIFNCGKC